MYSSHWHIAKDTFDKTDAATITVNMISSKPKHQCPDV